MASERRAVTRVGGDSVNTLGNSGGRDGIRNHDLHRVSRPSSVLDCSTKTGGDRAEVVVSEARGFHPLVAVEGAENGLLQE